MYVSRQMDFCALRTTFSISGNIWSPLIKAVTRLLGGRGDWPVRLRAAQALGELAKGSRDAKAVAALSRAARGDGYALVREASALALVKVDRAAARGVLEQVIKSDPEPRVRKSAQAMLSQKP